MENIYARMMNQLLKKILKFEGNDTRIYYDLESFISVKEQFNHYLKDKDKYKDKLQLVLVNYKKRKT